MSAFEEFDVKVSFSGTVKVMVPKGTRNAKVMAECFALSRIIASVENPDAPRMLWILTWGASLRMFLVTKYKLGKRGMGAVLSWEPVSG